MCLDTNASYDYFVEKITLLYNTCFPVIDDQLKQNKCRKPWISTGILRSISKKNRLYKMYLRKLSESSRLKYIVYKNKLTTIIRNAKKRYFYNLFEKCKGNMKKTWNEINNILGNRKQHALPNEMYFDDNKYSSREQIVEQFNSYFVSIGKKLCDSNHCIPNSFKRYLNSDYYDTMFLKPTTIHELLQICTSLNQSKSCGYDNISPLVVKETINCFVEPLCNIFNKSLSIGVFPESLKISKVVPLHEKDCPQNMKNYRPIAILSIFSKILEKIMHNRLYSFLSKYDVLINEQFGFRKNHSTCHGVLNLSTFVSNELDKGNFCMGLFMDLSKAFDTIDHHILLEKLFYYGVRGVALNWFKSYLVERKQYVVVDGVNSKHRVVTCGVPQGSVLGPLLFLVYINDILMSTRLFRFSLFADDTVAFMSHRNIHTLISIANTELRSLGEWFRSNKLIVNYDKTNYILFHSKKRRIPETIDDISMNHNILTNVKSLLFLGITIDECLDWKIHIQNVVLKISRSIGILSKLKYILPKNVLLLLYNSLVLPHLTYCNIVWGNSYFSHLNKIRVLQKRAIRIITHSEYNSPSSPLFLKMKILPIQELITMNTLIFMYNFHTGHLPFLFKTLFVSNSCIHSYSTRQRSLLHKPPVRSTHALNSFQNVGISKWNNLSENIRSSTTLSRFKCLCKRDLLQQLL